MGRFIAFHRAINVSGSKIIKMAHLRELYESWGYKNVATYIQTGNVYFETRATNKDNIVKKIETGLFKEFGFEVETFVYAIDELQSVFDKDPFKEIEDDGNAVIYFGFLQSAPSKSQLEQLFAFNSEIDNFKIVGKELYILRYRDKGQSKFTPKLVEQKLKTKCTTRNRKTIIKLLNSYNK